MYRINGVKPRKINVNGQRVRIVKAQGVTVWRAVPDYLFTGGKMDGDCLQGFVGPAISEDTSGSGTAAWGIAEGNLTLTLTCSSGYDNDYATAAAVTSNEMDLSAAQTIRIDGGTTAWGEHTYGTSYSISLGGVPLEMGRTYSLQSLGVPDLAHVRLVIGGRYHHMVAINNWYAGGGTVYVRSIACT